MDVERRVGDWKVGTSSPSLTLLLTLVLLVVYVSTWSPYPTGEIISSFHALEHYYLKYQVVTSQMPSPTSQAHKPHLYKTLLASPDR